MFKISQELTDYLQSTIDFSLTSDKSSLLLFIEITNIARISVIYGKDTDIYINQIKELIDQAFNEQKAIFTINNEFIVIIFNEKDQAEEKINKIYSLLQLFRSSQTEQPIHLTTIISSVNLPQESNNATDALEKAYLTSKNSRFEVEEKTYHSYSEIEQNKKNYKNQFILADTLKAALLEKKLRLAFQPIIDSKTGLVSHYECLLRMISEDGKLISAGPFIPIAEEMGFINLIDEIVLEMVVEELKYSPNITLTFNLSTLGVYNKHWLAKATKFLQDPALSARTIVEITETAAHKDLGKAAYFVATLQEMGCQVALDDFGSGHTSFRQLKALPVDIIKIDGAFVRDIVNSTESLMFVRTLITMSKGIGFKSVAEFVENGEIAKLLLEMHVDYMQGNYFCPALNYRSWAQAGQN